MTQDDVVKISPVVFVFGSNTEGRHGKGAAKEAVDKHGAVYGQPEGKQGNSYGIITKELRKGLPTITLDQVRIGVNNFLEYANMNRLQLFYVTKIGCGLAGFKEEDIKPMFSSAPSNVYLPKEWYNE